MMMMMMMKVFYDIFIHVTKSTVNRCIFNSSSCSFFRVASWLTFLTSSPQVISYLQTLDGQFVAAEEDTHTASILSTYQVQVEELKHETIATVPERICFDRFPGQGHGNCPQNATQAQGGGACQLVAQAFLEVTKSAHIAIQNGGGCRTDIDAGNFSHNDAYIMLPFSNTLVTLEMTGTQIKSVLEDALDFGLSDSTGAYPYAAGLRYDVNCSASKGNRISNLEVNPRLGGSWSSLDISATFQVVTNSYIAGGRDGYTTFIEAASTLKNSYIEYAEGLAGYCKDVGVLVEPPLTDFSTQAYTDKDGVSHGTGARFIMVESSRGIQLKVGAALVALGAGAICA